LGKSSGRLTPACLASTHHALLKTISVSSLCSRQNCRLTDATIE
jgi:hypothetical protein